MCVDWYYICFTFLIMFYIDVHELDLEFVNNLNLVLIAFIL